MADFDRILSSSPINATAARQLSKGEHWSPSIDLTDYFADMPQMKSASYYAEKLASGDPGFVDFRGMAFGRLVVIGVADRQSRSTARWVCRCKCGGFCTRSAKTLKVAMGGGNSFIAMCGLCDYQQRLRSGWSPVPKGVLRRG